MMQQEVGSIVEVLSDLLDDVNVPRNVRGKFEEVVTLLRSEDDNSVKVHEALNILDGISSDANIEPYTRTQVYSIVSMLEQMH